MTATESADQPDDLYRFDTVCEPVASPDLIGPAEVARFTRDGYLAVRGVLAAAEVADVLAGLAAVLESPGSALVEYEHWAQGRLATDQGVSGEQRMDLVRRLMRFVGEDGRLRQAAAQRAVTETVRRLAAAVDGRLGDAESDGSGSGGSGSGGSESGGAGSGGAGSGQDLVLYQDMALLKPPGGGREKPWHQDNAYFHLEPGTPIIGVWVALDPATAENGCMHVQPGSHREPVLHFQRRDLQVCDVDVDRGNDVVVPLDPGDALFFHGLLVHGTPANRSITRRRAVQFHYVPAGADATSDERHTAIFGGDALGASC